MDNNLSQPVMEAVLFQRIVATSKVALTAKPSIYEEIFGVIAFSP